MKRILTILVSLSLIIPMNVHAESWTEKNWKKLVIAGAVVAAALMAVGGTAIYLNRNKPRPQGGGSGDSSSSSSGGSYQTAPYGSSVSRSSYGTPSSTSYSGLSDAEVMQLLSQPSAGTSASRYQSTMPSSQVSTQPSSSFFPNQPKKESRDIVAESRAKIAAHKAGKGAREAAYAQQANIPLPFKSSAEFKTALTEATNEKLRRISNKQSQAYVAAEADVLFSLLDFVSIERIMVSNPVMAVKYRSLLDKLRTSNAKQLLTIWQEGKDQQQLLLNFLSAAIPAFINDASNQYEHAHARYIVRHIRE